MKLKLQHISIIFFSAKTIVYKNVFRLTKIIQSPLQEPDLRISHLEAKNKNNTIVNEHFYFVNDYMYM